MPTMLMGLIGWLDGSEVNMLLDLCRYEEAIDDMCSCGRCELPLHILHQASPGSPARYQTGNALTSLSHGLLWQP